MEILNENYVVIILEFKEERKVNINSLLVSLKGDKNIYNLLKENGQKVKYTDIIRQINSEFVKDILKEEKSD